MSTEAQPYPSFHADSNTKFVDVGNREEEAKKEKNFDVSYLAEKYGVSVVSAIRTYGNLGPFRPLIKEDFKGIRLFDILLRPGQIASCSTVGKGDTYENLYGRWGVILGKGDIKECFPYDATTSVWNGEVRSKFLPRVRGIDLHERVEETILSRQRYNELNVGVDKVAGVFYCVDEGDCMYEDFPADNVLDLMEPLQLPQFALQGGTFYQVETIKDIKDGKYCDSVKPADIVKTHYSLTVDNEAAMCAYLIKNLTLAPRNPITSGVNRGQFAYLYRKSNDNPSHDFYSEQKNLVNSAEPSLRLYAAMASYAYGDLARNDGNILDEKKFKNLGAKVVDEEMYNSYKSRILGNGNLSIVEEDFKTYLSTGELPINLRDH